MHFPPKRPALSTSLAAVSALILVAACETVPTQGEPAGTSAPAPVIEDPATGVGIFYPPVTSVDTPLIRFGAMPAVGARQRQLLTDQLNLAATSAGDAIPMVAQAVGEGNTTLVLMNVGAAVPPTTYTARAALARMTSVMRFSPALTEMGLSEEFDIYNMAAVMGFERIIVTDGRAFSHEARLSSGS